MKITELIARQGKSISFEYFLPKSKEDEYRRFVAIGRRESPKPAFVSFSTTLPGAPPL